MGKLTETAATTAGCLGGGALLLVHLVLSGMALVFVFWVGLMAFAFIGGCIEGASQ